MNIVGADFHLLSERAHNVCKPMRKMEPQRAPKRWKLAHEVLHCRVEKTWFFCLPLSDPLCIVLGFSGVAPGTSLFSSPAARRRLFFGITANPAASECPAPSLSLSSSFCSFPGMSYVLPASERHLMRCASSSSCQEMAVN